MVVLEKDEQPGHEHNHDHATLYTSVCATLSVRAPGACTRGQASESSDLLSLLLFHINIDFKGITGVCYS